MVSAIPVGVDHTSVTFYCSVFLNPLFFAHRHPSAMGLDHTVGSCPIPYRTIWRPSAVDGWHKPVDQWASCVYGCVPACVRAHSTDRHTEGHRIKLHTDCVNKTGTCRHARYPVWMLTHARKHMCTCTKPKDRGKADFERSQVCIQIKLKLHSHIWPVFEHSFPVDLTWMWTDPPTLGHTLPLPY